MTETNSARPRPEGLPKFLLANDATCQREFIIHTEPPLFVAECNGDPAPLEVNWIGSDEDLHHRDQLTTDELKALMDAATEFYLNTLRTDAGRN